MGFLLFMLQISPILVSFILCVGVCLLFIKLDILLVLKRSHQGHWIHEASTPRHGGIALFVSLLISNYLFNAEDIDLSYWLLLSSLPLLFAGILEDFSYAISPRGRIFANILSSLLAISIFQTSISSVEIPGVDWVLSFSAFAFLLTIFATTTLSQAYNLIDGLNGLSSGCGIIALAFIAVLTMQDINGYLYGFCVVGLGCLLGFWLLNILTGRLFLGDGGAYLIGHLVAWSSIIAADQLNNLTPWAFLLATAYPVIDVLTTVVRRKFLKQSLTEPDQNHFHHVINNLINNNFNFSRKVSNSIGSLVILVLQLGCMLFALRYKHHSLACFSVFFCCFLICFVSCMSASRREMTK